MLFHCPFLVPFITRLQMEEEATYTHIFHAPPGQLYFYRCSSCDETIHGRFVYRNTDDPGTVYYCHDCYFDRYCLLGEAKIVMECTLYRYTEKPELKRASSNK